MTHGHPEKFWFVLPGAGYHFLRFPRILNREPDLRTTALGRIMCTVLELVRGGESAFFSCSLCQGSRVTVEATYPQIPSPTHVWVMSEASHFQAGLTVGSSSPKCKPWGLECLPCTSPPANWSTFSFRVPTASNQGISESLPFFLLLWSFSLPQSAYVYSLLLFILICVVFICFHTAYWRRLMGWAPKCIPVIAAPEKGKCKCPAFLSKAEVTWRRCTSSCKFYSIIRSVSHAFSSSTMWSEPHPPPTASCL